MYHRFLLSFVLAAPLAFAGDRIGNGGDVLKCRFPGKRLTSYTVLDAHQAQNEWGLKLDLNEGLSADEKVRTVLRRLSQWSPERAKLYSSYLDNFWNETSLIDDATLVDVPDTGAQVIPKNCELMQLAVQRRSDEILPGQSRYIISRDLWNELDEVNKAVLLLHELIYREYLENTDLANAAFVRYFNAFLISDQIQKVLRPEIMTRLMLPFYENAGGVVKVGYRKSEKDQAFYPSWARSAQYQKNVGVEVLGLKGLPAGSLCQSVSEDSPHHADELLGNVYTLSSCDWAEKATFYLIQRKGIQRELEVVVETSFLKVFKVKRSGPDRWAPNQATLAEDLVHKGKTLCQKGSRLMFGSTQFALYWGCVTANGTKEIIWDDQ